MTQSRALVVLASAILVAGMTGTRAAQPEPSANTDTPAVSSDEQTQKVMAEMHFNDLSPGSGPIVVLDGALLRPFSARPVIDARIFNIYLIRKGRYPPKPQGASTGETITAWTNTVLLDSPQGYGSAIDQWIGMAYLLGPRL